MAGSSRIRGGSSSSKRQPSSNIQSTDSIPRSMPSSIPRSMPSSVPRSMPSSIPRFIPTHKQPPLASALPVPYTRRSEGWKAQQRFMDHCTFGFSPVHGHGVFATKDIDAGTMIMKEKALWVVSTHDAIYSTFSSTMDYTPPRLTMFRTFGNIKSDAKNEEEGERDQNDLITLCGGFDAEEAVKGDSRKCTTIMSQRLREILILNGVAESCDRKPGYAAVFRASSRLNHSCVPNAERMRSQLNDGSVWCHVYATSPIKKGEEIFINYVDPLAKFAPRQDMFRSRWLFTCACRFCKRPEEEIKASDARREKLEDAIRYIKLSDEAHTTLKPGWQSDASHAASLERCDALALGEKGWETLEALAAEEGVNDIKLYNSFGLAADGARRRKKLSLETKLVDRMLAVCRTHVISEEQLRNATSRREQLRRTAADLAMAAAKHLAQKAKAV